LKKHVGLLKYPSFGTEHWFPRYIDQNIHNYFSFAILFSIVLFNTHLFFFNFVLYPLK